MQIQLNDIKGTILKGINLAYPTHKADSISITKRYGVRVFSANKIIAQLTQAQAEHYFNLGLFYIPASQVPAGAYYVVEHSNVVRKKIDTHYSLSELFINHSFVNAYGSHLCRVLESSD